MVKRIHIPQLRLGDTPLDSAQAHHVRDVLRLADGTSVDVFDDAGTSARGVLVRLGPREIAVRVTQLDAPALPMLRWTVASAVPKGDRADWMVEKLSELGATAFVPLAADRSVVLPEGKGKHDRWVRVATESAKQSRRAGVMRIEALTPLSTIAQRVRAENESADRQPGHRHAGWFLSTEAPGMPIAEAVEAARGITALTLFVGPEGGWTKSEVDMFQSAGMIAVRLSATILRIETAAIAAGAAVACFLPGLAQGLRGS